MKPPVRVAAPTSAAGRLALLDTRRPRLALVLFCLVAWLPGFFSIPVTDRDEARFAQASKQMLESGDFVNIRNGAEARNRKPIGIHWLQAPVAAAIHAAGLATENPVWPYRVPSLLGALTAVLATYAIGRRMLTGRAALLGAAMLGGSLVLTLESGIAKTDAVLVGATTLAMGVLARAYLEPSDRLSRARAALFWLALGVGILDKGPLTPLVTGLAAVTLLIADRRARWLLALRPGWGIPLLLAVVLPWFVAIGAATGGQFFADAIGGDLGAKLAGGDDAHGAPPGFHLALLSLSLFPVAPLALFALPAAWAARRVPCARFLLAWLVPAWLVFEAVPTKLPHYILPLVPALCLIAAAWTLDPSRRMPPRWLEWLAIGLFAGALAFLGIGAVALPFVTVPAGWADLLGLPATLAALAIGWLVIRKLRGRDHLAASGLALLTAPMLYWAVLGLEVPHLASFWVAPRVAAALDAHPARGFAAVGYAEPSLMFAVGTETRMLPNGVAGARFLAAAPQRVVAVERREQAAFLAGAGGLGLAPRSFAEVDGFNYSNGRRVALTLYDAPAVQDENANRK